MQVDENDIIALMEQYKSNEREWGMYAFADASRGYTRNLVSRGNGKSNLLVLVWTPGKGSPIHEWVISYQPSRYLQPTDAVFRTATPTRIVSSRC